MLGLFRGKKRCKRCPDLYRRSSRRLVKPALFLDHEVPDTVEGRYDMMVLHAFLVVHRLAADPEAGRQTSQAVCDQFFPEMDSAFREMGVGDLAVPKRMKSIGELYSGCASAYARALGSEDRGELVTALSRNVYDDPSGLDKRAAPLADYVRRAAALLADTPITALVEKAVPFSDASLPGRHAA